MYKFAFKFFSIILAVFLINSSAFAINAEYKNSLMKIEIIKVADADYNLNLYTKSKFIEPIKIIKKNDLNYYVLLPETKNESVRTITQGTEIKNVSTNVYSYAGQDVNNGYIKINIDTTKPINFRINIKNSVAAAAVSSQIAKAILEEKEVNIPLEKPQVQAQKKNPDLAKSKKNELIKMCAPKKELPKAPIVQQEQIRIEEAVQKEVEKYREETLLEVNEELASLEEQYASKEILRADELSDIEKIANGDKKKSCICEKFGVLRDKISAKLAQYGIEFEGIGILLTLVAIVLVFAFLYFTKKDKRQPRLKTKAELEESFSSEQNEDGSSEVKNDGQYFVFDNNIKQTGFCDPATSAIKRNYELSSYEPELKNKYNRNLSFKKNATNEYDIIQKILKEDTIIDLPNGSFEQQVRTGQLKLQNQQKQVKPTETPVQKQEKPQQPKKETVVQQDSEPIVLSSVEIAPQRGFMLVSFNNNINLVGYIFDDVFALYNFKQPKLEKYDIKYRLSEKDDKVARFIVKVGDVKILVAVSKASMKLEVIL